MVNFTPNTDIDLHDSTIDDLRNTKDGLEIYVRAWNEKILVFVFHEVRHIANWIAVADRPEKFGEILTSPLIDQTKQRMESVKYSQEWIDRIRHYCIMDDTGQPVIEVIAESYEVKVEGAPGDS